MNYLDIIKRKIFNIENFSFIVIIAITICCYCLRDEFVTLKIFNDNIFNSNFISLVGNVVAILIGFVATTISVFFSITDKPVFERIRKRNQVNHFVTLYNLFFFIGIVVLIFSLVLISGCTFSEWLYLIYSLCLEIMFCCFLKLQRLSLLVLKSLMRES